MAQLPLDQAIDRFQANDERLQKFINDEGTYTTSGGQSVETVRSFMNRINFKSRGDFASGIAYALGDVSFHAGLAYLCKLPYTSTATTPDADVTHWSVWPGVTASALASSGGAELVGYGGRNVADALDDFGVNALNNFGIVVGAADNYTGLQAFFNAVPSDGSDARLPGNVVYKTTRPVKMTRRQTKLLGQSYHNTYIQLVLTGAMRGNWASGASYPEGDVVLVYDSATENYLPYRAVVTHTAGAFATDLAAGKWEIWAAISVQASDCSVKGVQVIVPAKGIGVAVQGAARFNPEGVAFVPEVNGEGYAMLLDDRLPDGTFSPGSYTHTIGPLNSFGAFTQGVKQFKKCVISAGTSGGINATRLIFNHFVGDACVHIQNGGGNSAVGNLFQSFTGGNSGSRPFTGGVGYGFKFGGETHFENNYSERFEFDFIPSSSSATYTIGTHTSDASNDIFPLLAGYKSPAFGYSGEGVFSEVIDGLTFQVQSLSGDGQTIVPKLRGMKVTGNGAARNSITISATGCRAGQRLALYNDSWPFRLVSGGSVDLGEAGPALVIGQEGTNVNGEYAQCRWAEFVFTPSNTWRLVSHDIHGFSEISYGVYSFAGNGETMTPAAKVTRITGNGAARTGALIAAGKRLGQELILYADSWAVSFASGAAVWGNGGAPTLGNGAGQVQCVRLIYTPSGWAEVGRTVRP